MPFQFSVPNLLQQQENRNLQQIRQETHQTQQRAGKLTEVGKISKILNDSFFRGGRPEVDRVSKMLTQRGFDIGDVSGIEFPKPGVSVHAIPGSEDKIVVSQFPGMEQPKVERLTADKVKDFTLSQGQTRFDPQGGEIASTAPERDTVIRSIGRGDKSMDVLFDKRTGEQIRELGPTGAGQQGGSLEQARQDFLSGNATKEQLALIRQDETEFVKDYVESFGALVGPRRSQELRKQGSLLFEVERLGSNPLPENITSTSAAVEYLVENLKFDEDQAKEIVRQIMRAERAVTE